MLEKGGEVLEIENYLKSNKISVKAKEKLRNMYNNGCWNENDLEYIENENMENELRRFQRHKGRFAKINTVVSCVSMSKQKMEAFQKTLYIFDRHIKKLILFYTEKSKEKLENIKNNIKIEIILINIEESTDDFNLLSNKIIETFNKYCPEYEEILIDNTLGFKLLSFALYKVSTELNIKTINWKQSQINDMKNGPSDIIPGSDRYNIIEAPKLENYKLYQNINLAANNLEFTALSLMYSHTNNYNREKIYKFLNLVFSESKLNTFGEFKKKVTESKFIIENLKLNHIEKKYFNRILLTILSIDDERDENKYENQSDLELIEEGKEWNRLNLKDIFYLNRVEKYFLWRYITLIIAEKRYDDFGYIRKKGEEFIAEDICFDKNFRYISKNLEIITSFRKFWDMYKKAVLYCYYYSDFENLYENLDLERISEFEAIGIQEYFDKVLEFSEKVERKIIIQNDYIYISNYNIKIKIDKLFEKKGMARKFILNLLDEWEKLIDYVDKAEIKKMIYNELRNKNLGEDPSESSVNKALSRIWKEIGIFNVQMKKIANIDDFFIVENKKIKVNSLIL